MDTRLNNLTPRFTVTQSSRTGRWYVYDTETRRVDPWPFDTEEEAGFAAFCANNPGRDV